VVQSFVRLPCSREPPARPSSIGRYAARLVDAPDFSLVGVDVSPDGFFVDGMADASDVAKVVLIEEIGSGGKRAEKDRGGKRAEK
jgi:hypothetical protein